MTLTAKQEAAVERIAQQGRYASAREALDAVLGIADQLPSEPAEEHARVEALRAKSLFQLMQESPLYGVELDFPRDHSPMRDLEL